MNMIKGEWKKIFSKPMTIVVICGLLFVPLLYNVIFLSAYWDPYGKTDQIPVAVVNEDKGATLDGKKLNVGRDFVDDLKKNDKFDWKFTNKEKALEGLKNEDYYLVLEIPKNFSKNATTLMDKDPKKMKFIYHTNAGKNYSGAQISSNAVAKINDQIKEAVTKQYAETVFDSFKQVADGLQKASDGAGELENGSKTLRDNMKKLADSTVTFEDGTAKLASGLTDARKGATDLNAGAAKLLNGADKINENLGSLNSGLGKLESGSGQLYAASKELETGAGKLSNGLGQLQDGTAKLQGATQQLNEGTKTLQGKLPQFTSGLNQVDAEVSSVTQQINQAEQEITQIKQQVDSKKAEFEQQQQALIDSINSNESIPDEQKQTLIAGIKKLTSQQFMDEQQQKAEQLKAKVDKVQELSAALQKLSKGGEDIQSAINKIADGQSQLYNGQTKLYNAQTQLYNGAVKLADGEKQFNSKFAELNSGITDAHTGAGKLADGQQQIVDGLKKSEQGSAALANGLTQLENGATKLANGSKELTNGSSKLYDGSSKLSDGTSELHSSLADGAKDAKDVKADDKTYSMFSNPTDLKSDKQNNVDKYGVGLAPYILCIGLFAGTLMFSAVYPMKEPSIRPTSGISWFLSKFSVITIVGMLQAAIAVTALLWGLHLNVTSIWHFYIFTMITGVTFFTLILFLTTGLGKVGQYLAFIILLLQIGGSAGTFPKALVPEFFQAINPYLPMTYAIRGFREIISIGDDFGYVWHQAGVLGIFAAIFITLSLIMFYINARKEKHHTEEEAAA
ncbi:MULTISPECIES: YhgE/Pip domain-containing protein [Priestia]|uniref:YhgE/Pip domain-containing protein n=1 Tax=Priestia TaxID=2800373 RepID=UPI000BED3712|nr:YhgE/Pip domain-containing protein [Priestia megaterium]MDW4508030.1 YhgE/Pip domain-containing protein [Priestia megaterium]PEC46030.1 ABC transporter [Priestia megaterium]